MAAPASAPERWRVQRPVSRRATTGEWEGVLASTHVGFDVRFTDRTPPSFLGAVVRRRYGDLMLVDCLCTPFSGHHGGMVGAAGESSIGFQTVRRGTERVRYAGTEHVVTAGEAILWDGAYPVDVEVVEPFVKRTLIVPREKMLAMCPRLADLPMLPPLGNGPAVRLLARYLDVLAEELSVPEADEATARTAADVALELLRAAVEPGIPDGRAALREALRADVRRHIRLRLQDPALSPESIAKAHAISLRSLHSLFEDTGESVAALVRRSRLEHCRADLERTDGGSVTDIAFRWGFSDAAHFSTVFKREYGITPRDVRREALRRTRK